MADPTTVTIVKSKPEPPTPRIELLADNIFPTLYPTPPLVMVTTVTTCPAETVMLARAPAQVARVPYRSCYGRNIKPTNEIRGPIETGVGDNDKRPHDVYCRGRPISSRR